MKPTALDRAFFQKSRPMIDKALAQLGEDLGVQFHAGNASFDISGASGHFKLEVLPLQAGGEVVTPEASAFESMAKLYGFDAGDLGRTFRTGGVDYRITGLKPRARRYPVTADRVSDGRGFKFPADVVLNALKAAKV